MRTEAEQQSHARGRRAEWYSIEELCILYKYANQWERLLLLLGLNFGFAQSEIQSLKIGEVKFDADKIERVRRKKGVYGEFTVWPETKGLLQWALDRRLRQVVDADGVDIRPTDNSYLILTDDGRLVYRQTEKGNRSDSIANAWGRLHKRIKKDHSGFRKLEFKYLRKTAGHLVRSVSDGEVAGTFHSRARVVRTDDEADEYTGRPFDKVAEALAKVHDLLKPMFKTCPEGPMEDQNKGSGPKISRAQIDRVKDMFAAGERAPTIAIAVGVSLPTVYR